MRGGILASRNALHGRYKRKSRFRGAITARVGKTPGTSLLSGDLRTVGGWTETKDRKHLQKGLRECCGGSVSQELNVGRFL